MNKISAGQVRTLLSAVSEGYQQELGTQHVLFPWAVRHGLWLHSRFSRGQGRHSPCYVIKGKNYKSALACFGETVHCLQAAPGDRVEAYGLDDPKPVINT